jgi:hypothetical protein
LLSREAGIGIVYALLTGAASNVMNNVGALALLLPAALGSCRAAHVSPSRVLMPMAFVSLLGGLVTMIGTPPNILLAQMRADLGGTAFAMFDFARVGLPLAVIGIAMTLLLVRLLPVRAERDEQPLKFRIADYLFELRVPDGMSPDLTVERLAATMPGADRLDVHAIDRGGLLVTAPRASRRLLPGDIVQVEGSAAVCGTGVDPMGAADCQRSRRRSAGRCLCRIRCYRWFTAGRQPGGQRHAGGAKCGVGSGEPAWQGHCRSVGSAGTAGRRRAVAAGGCRSGAGIGWCHGAAAAGGPADPVGSGPA